MSEIEKSFDKKNENSQKISNDIFKDFNRGIINREI